jgi:type III restriction enzyme
MMELHQRYGWSKFIVVVPSVAIREGVKKSFDITADHFQQLYGTKPRSFIYNSSQLHELERFSSDAGVQVMIINIQAFNARGKDNRRIYDELDDFQSRRPIDVIKANRPIVIIDEPQKMSADNSLKSLAEFNALMVLRYSATHRVEHTRCTASTRSMRTTRSSSSASPSAASPSRVSLERRRTCTSTGSRCGRAAASGTDRARGADQGGPIKRQVKRVTKGSASTTFNGLEAYRGSGRHRHRRQPRRHRAQQRRRDRRRAARRP